MPTTPRLPVRARHGQATTEWLLLISVGIVAIVAAGYGMASTFGSSMSSAGRGASQIYTSGDLGR